MADDDKEFPKLTELLRTPTVFDEADATPDEAHELGWTAGYDEAARVAVEWARSRFDDATAADLITTLIANLGKEE